MSGQGDTKVDARAPRGDEPSTIVDGARAVSGAASLDGSTSPAGVTAIPTVRTIGATASATTTQALFDEEAERTRSFGRVMALVCLAMCLFLPLMGGPPLWRLLTGLALASLIAVSVWVYMRGARSERYDANVYRVFGATAALTSLVVDYYLGVFSPAPMATTLGISFFGLSGETRVAYATCAVAGVGYVVLALLVGSGVLPDHGVLGAMTQDRIGRVSAIVMVPIVFGVALWQARVSRAATISAIERAQNALRVAGQREAQLEEANQHLDRALHLGKGQEGRHTGAKAGDYVLCEVLGRGAMGEVYAAEKPGGQRVAIKVLSALAEHDRDLVERMHREGQLAAKIDSPHVVRVIESGALTDGAPFLAMELLVGQDLASILRKQRTLDVDEVVEMVHEVARGLDVAHEAGVIHRDIKPQNLFLSTRDGASAWKVIDFGISKHTDTSGTLTKRSVIGTPGFMSPEQTRGQPVDARSDIFSLGSVAYRALVGRPAFSGPDMPSVMFDIAYRMPSRPSELAHRITDDVERALGLALAKRAEDRFSHAGEFAAALAAASRHELSATLRARADALLAQTPWGKRLKDR